MQQRIQVLKRTTLLSPCDGKNDPSGSLLVVFILDYSPLESIKDTVVIEADINQTYGSIIIL
jgi:hypothetical protein